MNEKYKFTIDKLVSIEEIIKNIEETNYIDGYLGYEDDFYIDSILYYLKENARLKDKMDKANVLTKRIKDDVWGRMADCYEDEDNYNGDFLNIEINSIDRLLELFKEN